MTWLWWLGALAVGSSLSLLAQQTASPPAEPGQSFPSAPAAPRTLIPRTADERKRAYQAAHHIVLNVVATDGSGEPVQGLSEQDFTLLDNGMAEKIASFQVVAGDAARARVHVILMLDTVNSTSRNVATERREIEKFLGTNEGRLPYPVAVGALSNAGVTIGKPSQDGKALIAELGRLAQDVHAKTCTEEANEAGATNPSASVVSADGQAVLQTENLMVRMGNCENRRYKLSISQLNQLAKQQADTPGRAILIWIGGGWPQLTGPEFRPDTPAAKQAFFDYLVDLSTSLREAQITLNAVSSPESLRAAETSKDAGKASLSGAATEEQASAASLALPVLARMTGGRVLDKSKDISAGIAACLADAASYYVLSFDSAPASRTGEHRSLEVRVNRPGVTVRTSTAYYAQP